MVHNLVLRHSGFLIHDYDVISTRYKIEDKLAKNSSGVFAQ